MRIAWQVRGNSIQTVRNFDGVTGFAQEQPDGTWFAGIGGKANLCWGLRSRRAAIRWANAAIRQALAERGGA